MTKMDFESKTLERLSRSFKWARNNSLHILDAAQKQGIMSYQPEGEGQRSILYQFQCLATTTDTYYRKLSHHTDKRFGIVIREGIIRKRDIQEEDIESMLTQQVLELEDLFRHFTASDCEANMQDIQSIANHEYLHQGQLVVMFRSAGAVLPERFRLAFDL